MLPDPIPHPNPGEACDEGDNGEVGGNAASHPQAPDIAPAPAVTLSWHWSGYSPEGKYIISMSTLSACAVPSACAMPKCMCHDHTECMCCASMECVSFV